MKNLSLFWKITIGLVVVFALMVGIFALIPLNNAPALAKSDIVSIKLSYPGYSATVNLENDEFYKDRFDSIKSNYEKMRKFNLLRGILEGQAGGMKVSDEETVLTASEISAKSGDSSTAMVVFTYNELHTETIKSVKFEYNEAKILIKSTGGDIGSFTIILYNRHKLANGSGVPAEEGYEVRTITAKGKCTKLYDAVKYAVDPNAE